MSTLVVAEQRGGHVLDVTHELISAAMALGDRVLVAAIGAEPETLNVSREGVDEVVRVRTEQAEFEGDVYQAAVERLIDERKPDTLLLAFTANAVAWGAALAAKCGLGFASDVFGLRRNGGDLLATRAFYGGKLHAELDFPAGAPVVLLLRPKIWPPAAAGKTPKVSELTLGPVPSRARHLEFLHASGEDGGITKADLVLAIGRGIGDRGDIPLFERVAEKLGAALAVSRPIVEAGLMPSTRQVGQSGQTVKPKVYLALGISGAAQHVVGMKDSDTIIAVNNDPGAPIFGVAHYGAIADVFDIARALNTLL